MALAQASLDRIVQAACCPSLAHQPMPQIPNILPLLGHPQKHRRWLSALALAPSLAILIHEGLLGALLSAGFLRALTAGLAALFLLWRQDVPKQGQAKVSGFILWVVLLCAVPFEAFVAPSLDPILQSATAHASRSLLWLSGRPLAIVYTDTAHGEDPVLMGKNLEVTITPQCAGSQTFLALVTLGALLIALHRRWRNAPKAQMRFLLWVMVLGFAANTLRVVLSTHAAPYFGHDKSVWALIHDGLGYFFFGLLYLLLFGLLKRGSPTHTAQDES